MQTCAVCQHFHLSVPPVAGSTARQRIPSRNTCTLLNTSRTIATQNNMERVSTTVARGGSGTKQKTLHKNDCRSPHLQRSVPISSLLERDKLRRHSLSHSGFLVSDARIRSRGVSAWEIPYSITRPERQKEASRHFKTTVQSAPAITVHI